MANPEHVKVVRQGAKAIAQWRENNQLTALDLSKADLRRADLTGADLTGADLTGADLTGADLTGADLTGAYVIRVDLSETNLRDSFLAAQQLVIVT